MTSRDFAFWLQGFFEINEAGPQDEPHNLSPQQVDMIKRHLNLVFKHEIEPSMDLSEEEKKIHDGTDTPLAPPYSPWVPTWPYAPPYVPGDGTSIPYVPSSPIIYC